MGVLSSFGWSMVDTHEVGLVVPGFPDAIGGLNDVTDLFEFKVGKKAKLEETQVEFTRTWRGSKVVRLDSKAHAIEWATRTRHERRRQPAPKVLPAVARVAPGVHVVDGIRSIFDNRKAGQGHADRR
jgi:hypothetical protein